MRALVAALAAAALALSGTAVAASGPAAGSAAYLAARQSAGGGFAEDGQAPDASLTAWAALALVAADGPPAARAGALEFLRGRGGDVRSDTDLALRVTALAALGDRPADLLARLRRHRPGALVNATVWTLIALRAVGEPAPQPFVEALLGAQSRSGGWSWSRGGRPDSNDTAAAIQALRAAGVTGAPIRRAAAFLRTFQNRDGGFALAKGRDSDAQSTAWAIQGLIAAGQRPGAAAFRYLSRLRRPDGSYRYSARYATTPVWVTAQVVPALAGRSFPLGRA